jgi:hypothetical protein
LVHLPNDVLGGAFNSAGCVSPPPTLIHKPAILLNDKPKLAAI